jgi:hypothetical protein
MVAVLSLQLAGAFVNTGNVLARAYAATESLTSYRLVKIEYAQQREADEPVLSSRLEIDYAGADRFRWTHRVFSTFLLGVGEIDDETIVIDDDAYVRGRLHSDPSRSDRLLDQAAPSREATLASLDWLVSVERLPDETIDGVVCYHYRGTGDEGKIVAVLLAQQKEYLESRGLDPSGTVAQQMEESAREQQRELETVYDFWIGKDDYLVRQWQRVTRGQPMAVEVYEMTGTFRYSDFNTEIVIRPPLTESGELLPGWHLYSIEE